MSLRSFPGMGMQLHITSSFYQLTQNCTGVFNAAAEGKTMFTAGELRKEP